MRVIVACVLSACWSAAQLPEGQWRTDMSRKSIELSELHKSLAKDAIPAIDRPEFTSVTAAAAWLSPNEPVLVYEYEQTARAYPVQILLFHELVNDTVAGRPILVSFCPLCNSGLIFDRSVDGETREFGVAGLLRHSDMIMYDRQTDSLWQQLTGEAIVGSLTGKRLVVITGQMVSFATFQANFPDGDVLGRPLGTGAPYGISLYENYERGHRNMLPAGLPRSPPVPPLERVLTLERNGSRKAYPFEMLRRARVYEDKIKGLPVVIFFKPEMKSAMDAKQIADSRAVGTAGAFSPILEGRRLRFKKRKGKITDKQTGSVWNVLGRAVEGPLAGRHLEQVPSGVFFAFAVTAFHPRTRFVGVIDITDR